MSRQPFADALLLKLVKSHDYSEQADLQTALKANGVEIPQATLSRRLKKLSIVKVDGFYQIIQQRVLNPITNITALLPNLVIINTLPGHANSIAYLIDKEFVANQLYGITGTIAGDDTIFVAIQPLQTETAYQHLKLFFAK